MLPSRVASAIRRHRVFEPGQRVLVAVSGGPDSLALLAILRELLPALPLALTVAHFDHGWRPTSASDADFVKQVAERWGFAFITGRASSDLRHTEAAAREARYAFLRQAAAQSQSTIIAVGHTRDDQVETLLLHLLRGSGSRGLAGMRYRSGDLARPLLGIARDEIERYLADQSLKPRRDPTNDEPRYTRNRLRQTVLPAIDAFSPSARRLLAQTAQILADEDRLLEAQVDSLAASVTDDPATLRSIDPAIHRRLLRRRHPEMNFLQTESARRNPVTATAQARKLPQLKLSSCNCDRLSFRARDSVGHLDADRVRLPLSISSRHPGDRMRPLGMAYEKLIQDLLVDARVPRQLRDALPIVRDREEIVWIPCVSVAESKRVTAQTQHQLHLEIGSA